MNDPLFPYQHVGAHFLWKKKYALLADEMGLGKSAQAIRGCDLAYADRILVVCPAVARANWEREFGLFSVVKRTIKVLYDGNQEITNTDAVVVVSYDLLDRYKAALGGIRWDVLIADEAHFLKNRKATRTKELFKVAKSAKKVWFLSGTPAPNNVTELWPMLHFCGATKLDYWPFVERYAITKATPWGVQVIKSKSFAVQEIKEALKDIMLRRLKEDVLKDLPPIFYQEVAVEAKPFDEQLFFFNHLGQRDPELDATLEAQRQQIEWVVDNLGTGDSAIKTLESSKMGLSTLRRYVGLQKVASITELVKSDLLENGVDKIVIMAIHQNVIETLRTTLREFNPVTIYSGTPADKRDKNVQSFQTNPKCRVFIGQIVAAGTAITLTAAHHVLFAETSWVPAENAQAAMRCHRIGQTKPVTVRFAYIPGSIDEAVTRAVKRKTSELTKLFDQ